MRRPRDRFVGARKVLGSAGSRDCDSDEVHLKGWWQEELEFNAFSKNSKLVILTQNAKFLQLFFNSNVKKKKNGIL